MVNEENSTNLRHALDWFLSFLEPSSWIARKTVIEEYLERVLLARRTRDDATEHESISVGVDPMGWYLYLAETALTAVEKYEPLQGARVIPIFERIGENLDLVMEINGIDEKVKFLTSQPSVSVDSTLFEILVALLWKRNGWRNVWLLPESPLEKRPDILIDSLGTRWAVECKRLAKTSEYSNKERTKWLRLWRPLSDFLVRHRLPVILDIVFHVELETLSDEFVAMELAGKLPLIHSYPSHIVSNDVWDVRVSRSTLERAKAHLRHNYVKLPSNQLNELIGDRPSPEAEFTTVVGGQVARLRAGRGLGRYLDTIDFAAGAFWRCDSPIAIRRKARDVRKRLSDAIEQLPQGIPCVVHIGLETLDGPSVEAERIRRIFDSLGRFDARGRDLRWVYCHLYQSYAPPDQAWVVDETVYYFSRSTTTIDRPLIHLGTIVPESELSDSGVHWLREPP